MRLMHNLASLNLYYKYEKNIDNQSKALNRISSGKKITCAADSPIGLAKSERMNFEIRGLQSGSQNSQDGVSMLQTAEGGLNNITDEIQRMRQLVVQSGGGDLTTNDKQQIQTEIEQIKKDINTISNNTDFNGVNLLNATSSTGVYDNNNPSSIIKSAVTGMPGETIDIPKFNVTTGMQDSTGNTLQNVDVTAANSVDSNLAVIDASLQNIIHCRSVFGGLENIFSETSSNADAISDEIQSAESGIGDADIASEMMEYSKDGILQQAGIAMMAQTNKFPQDVLNILSQIRSR